MTSLSQGEPISHRPQVRYPAESAMSVIAEHISDAIIMIDERSRIHYVNAATAEMFGYAQEELIGEKLTILMPERYHQLHNTGIERYVKTGERHVDWKVVMLPGLHKDGHTVSLGISFGEFSNDGERMFIGIARDIAGPTRLIEELRHAKEDAEATEHNLALSNKAKDRFLAIVSHELRSPLTPILAALDAMKLDELQPFVEIIQRNVELEVRLINDLLDLTRLSSGKFRLRLEPIDIHKLLWEVVATYKGELAARKLSIELDLDAARHHVNGDPSRLDQVFWNLINNAMKFTPENGRISIHTENADDRIAIVVRDTGIGIEPDLLKRIFEAFEQGNHVPGYLSGLGLGLTISKDLIEAHGGSIKAASEGQHKGTTFTVEIPVTAVKELPDATPPSSNLTPHATDQNPDRNNILLVDDQPDTSVTLRILLNRRGYQVATAKSVAEAIRIVRQLPIDLIVSDILLPDGTGLEMLPKLQAIHNVPAIALSGLGSEEDIRRSLEAGFEKHITKPFNFQDLLDSIAELLTRSTPVEEVPA